MPLPSLLLSFSNTIPPSPLQTLGKNVGKKARRLRDRCLALCFPARPEQAEINSALSLPPSCLFLFLLDCALCLKKAQFSYIPIAIK